VTRRPAQVASHQALRGQARGLVGGTKSLRAVTGDAAAPDPDPDRVRDRTIGRTTVRANITAAAAATSTARDAAAAGAAAIGVGVVRQAVETTAAVTGAAAAGTMVATAGMNSAPTATLTLHEPAARAVAQRDPIGYQRKRWIALQR
jgi:hypothetical protein